MNNIIEMNDSSGYIVLTSPSKYFRLVQLYCLPTLND